MAWVPTKFCLDPQKLNGPVLSGTRLMSHRPVGQKMPEVCFDTWML